MSATLLPPIEVLVRMRFFFLQTLCLTYFCCIVSSFQPAVPSSTLRDCRNGHHDASFRWWTIAASKTKAYDEVEFPPPLNTAQRLQRAATFWSTALPIVASYYGLISRLKLQDILGDKLSDAEVENLWKSQHAAGAEKLSETILVGKIINLFLFPLSIRST